MKMVIIKSKSNITFEGESLESDECYSSIDCFCCKEKNVKLFMVPDSEWIGVVPENIEYRVICWDCYCKFREQRIKS